MAHNMTDSDNSHNAHADWEALVEAGLKGGSLADLMRQTEDGIRRGPLFTASDRPEAVTPLPRSNAPLLDGRPWHICAPVRDPDLAFANQQMLDDLKGGASSARVTLGDLGVKVTRTADIDRLFEGVYTDLIPINFRDATNTQIDTIFGATTLHTAHVNLGLDIIDNTAAIKDITAQCPKSWRAITLRAANVHESGGTNAQELAVMAGSVVMAMNTLGPEMAHAHMSLELAADRDAHLTIAKIRAARRIYARIAQSYGLDDLSVPIHTVTSLRMMQTQSPWTNMLRVMSAGFGAVIGGADFVTLRPFTDALGGATPFGYRTARNMQVMMMEESHLGQVRDPAFGSYFHERVSNDLAQTAWSKFQDIQAQGGIERYVTGPMKDDIHTAKNDRKDKAAPIVGVTLHQADPLREPALREGRK